MRALFIALLLAAASPASALEFRRDVADDMTFLSLEGTIEQNDGARFASFATDDRVAVLLKSEGGNIEAAMAIGRHIRAKGFVTAVRGGDRCVGACALVWLSGRLRGAVPTSRIGFANHHVASGADAASSDAVMRYLKDIGASFELMQFVMERERSDTSWLTPEIARDIGISFTSFGLPAAGAAKPAEAEAEAPDRDETGGDDLPARSTGTEHSGPAELRVAAFDFECRPFDREGPDPTDRIIVSKDGERWDVRHVTLSGETYDRNAQYRTSGQRTSSIWSGQHRRRNDTQIRGEIYREGEAIYYNEKVFRAGELFADMTAKCEER